MRTHASLRLLLPIPTLLRLHVSCSVAQGTAESATLLWTLTNLKHFDIPRHSWEGAKSSALGPGGRPRPLRTPTC